MLLLLSRVLLPLLLPSSSSTCPVMMVNELCYQSIKKNTISWKRDKTFYLLLCFCSHSVGQFQFCFSSILTTFCPHVIVTMLKETKIPNVDHSRWISVIFFSHSQCQSILLLYISIYTLNNYFVRVELRNLKLESMGI